MKGSQTVGPGMLSLEISRDNGSEVSREGLGRKGHMGWRRCKGKAWPSESSGGAGPLRGRGNMWPMYSLVFSLLSVVEDLRRAT